MAKNVVATRGLVSSDNPIATQIGVEVLRAGGSAADATVAVAAALNVLQPNTCGLGGDAIFLYYADRKVECIEGIGRSGERFTQEEVESRGFGKDVPSRHALTVTVPGSWSAITKLHELHGTLGMQGLLKPAIELAETGFAVQENNAALWSRMAVEMKDSGFPLPLELHLSGVSSGTVVRLPGLARLYRELSVGGFGAFYRGRVAKAIVDAVQSAGGLLTAEDIAAQEPKIGNSLYVHYRMANGKVVRVHQPPPPSQGIVMLEALAIYDELQWQRDANDALKYHAIAETLRVGFHDVGKAWRQQSNLGAELGDTLLSSANISKWAAALREDQCVDLLESSSTATLTEADTTYFAVVDGDGQACSAVFSNFGGFGTPHQPQGWGLTLHNRGYSFWESMHCRFQPCTRPYHTIMAGMITDYKSDEFMSAFGVMGGPNQPQAHLQTAVQLLDNNASPYDALNTPRIRWDIARDYTTPVLRYEDTLQSDVVDALRRLHPVARKGTPHSEHAFGRGHVIRKGGEGYSSSCYVGAADPRWDGVALPVY